MYTFLHRTVCCSIGYLQLTGQITGICSCVSIRGAHEGNVRAFIKDILSRREMNAAVDRGAEADTDDQFLTLSTHDYAGEEFRFLVQAYLQEKVT